MRNWLPTVTMLFTVWPMCIELRDYRNKVGGVCFVFEYKNIIGAQPEMFYIYVKCSGKTAKYRVRSIKKEDCSLEEILPGDNFSSLGGRYQYNGEKIISLKLTPDVAP